MPPVSSRDGDHLPNEWRYPRLLKISVVQQLRNVSAERADKWT